MMASAEEDKTICEKKTSALKQSVSRVWNGIRQDLTPVNKDFKYTLMWCGGLTISLFLSMFMAFFVWVTLVLCIAAALISKGGRSSYILVFLLPFNNIFRITSTDVEYLSYVTAVVVALLGIKYAISLLQKKQKFELYPAIICLAIIIFYFTSFTFNTMNIVRIAGQATAVLFLYLMWVYRRDINLREIFSLLFFALALSAVFGLFAYSGGIRTSKFIDLLSNRYGGITGITSFAFIALTCMAVLLVLYLNGDMKYAFYPLFTLLVFAVFVTGSKMAYVVFAFLIVFLFGVLFVRFINGDSQRKKAIVLFVVVIAIICSSSFFIVRDITFSTINRVTVIESLLPDPTQEPPPGHMPYSLDTLTTFRTTIWKVYFDAIFSSPRRAFFGFGVGADDIGVVPYSDIKVHAHNTYVHALYYIGFFGVALLVVWALIMFIPLIKQKKINWMNCMAIISLGMFIMSIHVFSYLLSIYLLIVLPTLTYYGNQRKERNNSNYECISKNIDNDENSIP